MTTHKNNSITLLNNSNNCDDDDDNSNKSTLLLKSYKHYNYILPNIFIFAATDGGYL